MKIIFQQGDRVFDAQYGWGLIIEISKSEHDKYPITVRFKDLEGDDEDITYTLEGKRSSIDLNPALSFTEYDFVNGGFSQDRKDIAITNYRIVEQDQYLIKCDVIMNQGIHINKPTERYFLVTAKCFSDACEKIEKEYSKLHITCFDNCTI